MSSRHPKNEAENEQKRAQEASLEAAGRLLRGEPEQAATNESATATPLSRKQAEILLKADAASLAEQVKKKRPLSAGQRNYLQSIIDGGKASTVEYVGNVVELAAALGVSRRTVSRWKKIDGCPVTRPDGRYHVQSWREFRRARGLDEDSEVEEIDVGREKARNILLQNERLIVQIAVQKRNWMPTQEVERIGGELGTAIRKVVSTLHQSAPNLVGVSVAEAEQRLKEIEDEVLQQLHLLNESIEEWKNSAYEPVV